MDSLMRFLVDAGVAPPHAAQRWSPLTGGVSSEIWRVDIAGRASVCVKRALAKLKVEADWHAPTSRNAHEWAWMLFAAQVLPNAVPTPLAHDESAGLFAMSWLAPDDHPVWKQQLMAGTVRPETARAVGEVLGRVHAASCGRDDVRQSFETTDTFHALRLEPYLLYTAVRHPALADRLRELSQATARERHALVHGDVSPKNILVGAVGPVFLDAECAWYGDPAFDVAFCLNHLLLKVVVRPDSANLLQASFAAFVEGYFRANDALPRAELEARAAALLPALLLARVDGKSPVEYLHGEEDRARVRAAAIPLLRRPVALLAQVAEHAYPRLMP